MLTAQIELAKPTTHYVTEKNNTAVYITMRVLNPETQEIQEFQFRYDTLDLYNISDFANILPLKEGVTEDNAEVTINLEKTKSITKHHLCITPRRNSPDLELIFGDTLADEYITLTREQEKFLTQSPYGAVYLVKMTPRIMEQNVTLKLTREERRISLTLHFDNHPALSRELRYATANKYNNSKFARLLPLSSRFETKKVKAVLRVSSSIDTAPALNEARYLLQYNSNHNDWSLDDPLAQNVVHFSSDMAKNMIFGTTTPAKTDYIISIQPKSDASSCVPIGTLHNDPEVGKAHITITPEDIARINEFMNYGPNHQTLTPTPVINHKESHTMAKTLPPPLFETVFLCRGENIDNLNLEQIYEAIAKEEQKIAELQNIDNKPNSLKQEISDRKAQIQNLVKYLDNEENAPG